MAKYTEARRKANEKYNAKAYEEIKIRVKTGEKELIQAHGIEHDGSLNKFINRAIKETMERDSQK